MIAGKGDFVRRYCCVVFLLCAAAVVGSPARALDPLNAWTRSGPPLAANAFVSPRPGGSGAIAQLNGFPAGDTDHSGGGIFDEIRLGVLGFWQDNAGEEEGVYVTGQVLFDPFVPRFDNWFLNVLLRPRPHLGGTVSVSSGTNQLFGGLTWTVPVGRIFFAEASFGGTVHDGPLSGAEVSLGCRFLFRESVGVGANLGPHWRVVAGVDHSSHNEFCGNDNDGLTHIGGSVGYRF